MVVRKQAEPNSDHGNQRYRRYVAAFDRVIHCINNGYNLEAIAVLDSLLSDRLHSRLSYLCKGGDRSINSLGNVCVALVGKPTDSPSQKTLLERDPDFQQVIKAIQEWAQQRNEAIHGSAKILQSRDDLKSFSEILESHQKDAVQGVYLLQQFDKLDRGDRKRNNAVDSATDPNAFFPENRRGMPLRGSINLQVLSTGPKDEAG